MNMSFLRAFRTTWICFRFRRAVVNGNLKGVCRLLNEGRGEEKHLDFEEEDDRYDDTSTSKKTSHTLDSATTPAETHADSSLILRLLTSRNFWGETALHIACRIPAVHVMVSLDIVQCLLDEYNKHGFTLDSLRSNDGRTPLHTAVVTSDARIVELLLDANANPNARDRQDMTPLHVLACQGNCYETILLMMNPNYVTLRAAGEHHDWSCGYKVPAVERTVQVLRNHGANWHLKTNKGYSVYDLALRTRASDSILGG